MAAVDPTDNSTDWPLAVLRRRLEQAGAREAAKNGFAVLVTTGAMNPPHRGHAQLLRQAAARVEAAGYGVAGAWLSPSHDGYVQPKATSLSTIGFSAPFRLEVARRLVASDPLLVVGAWEASPARSNWPDFPVVTRALQRELECLLEFKQLKGEHGHVQIFYCCGTDHAEKCGLYSGMGAESGVGVVVVPRTGESPRPERPDRLVLVAEPAAGEVAGFSSTKLRKALEKRDFKQVSAATSPEAAELLLQPTPEQLATFKEDYDKLMAAA